MQDSELFETRAHTFSLLGKTRRKHLLKQQYREQVRDEALKQAKKLAQHKDIAQVHIIGSLLRNELGKYTDDTNARSKYSDIDLFVVTKKPLKELSLADLGLVKKKYTENGTSYYRYSIGEDGKPHLVLGRFSIDLWLSTPYTLLKTMQRVPTILDEKITIKE